MNGSAGESMSLTVEERKRASVTWMKACQGRLVYLPCYDAPLYTLCFNAVNGSAGESMSLTVEERKQAAVTWMKACQGR